MLARGPAALRDTELLAILLRTGIQGKGVLQMAEELLRIKTDSGSRTMDAGFGGIAGLLNATPADLKRVKGLGPAKRAEIVAVLELARRAMAQQLKERTVFADPDTIKHYLQLHLAARSYEVFAVIFLDAQNRLLAMEEMFRDTLTQLSIALLRKTFWLVSMFHSYPVREPMQGFRVLATGRLRVVQRMAGLASFANFAYAPIGVVKALAIADSRKPKAGLQNSPVQVTQSFAV